MKKRYLLISIPVLLFGLAGCGKENQKPMPLPALEEVDNSKETTVSKPKEELSTKNEVTKAIDSKEDNVDENSFLKAVERVKTLDYKNIIEGGLARSKKLAPSDRELRKWIIRIHMYNEIRGEKIDDKTLLKDAKSALARRTAWFEYVGKEYEVKSSKSEIDAYIKKEATNNEDTEVVAKVLGMTAEYMNSDYERDQYHQQLLWTKLIPELKKKFPKAEDESTDSHIARINSEFNKELDKYITQ